MSNVQEQIAQAKAAGYSDADISAKLSSMPAYAEKIKTATSAGYKPEEIVAHLSGGKSTPEPKAEPEQSLGQKAMQLNRDIGGGLVRGAGSIGSTLLELTPIGAAQRYLNGKGIQQSYKDRTQAIDATLSGAGADTESAPYQLGKTGAEIAGTLGVGPALGGVVKGAQVASPVIQRLANAIQSSGMTVGQGGGAVGNALTRAAGGGISGAGSAALVNPEQAATGATIGALLPQALQGVGAVGRAIGSKIAPAAISPDLQAAAKSANDLGYVIPPTQVNPTVTNRLLEGFAGKLSTAQNASAKNASVTDSLAARAIGLPAETKLTPEVLDRVRKDAGKAYEAVADLPVRPAQKADLLSNKPAVDEVNPKDMVFDLRKARNDSTAWYNSYARTADPDSLAKAQAAKSAATKLQKELEDYAKSVGREDLVPAMVEARQLIAKTYSVEKALNPTTGSVDARKLGAMIEKGKPLTSELRQAGEFANRFPKAAQTPEKMGSLPQMSPLDWAAGGATSFATGNPMAMAAILARPAARAAALSKPVQNRLAQPSNSQLRELLADPELQQLLVRSAPASSAR